MSTTEAIAAVGESVTDERTEKIRGLREMADFLEAHPEIPAPSHLTGRSYFYSSGRDAATFTLIAQTLQGEIKIDGSDVETQREFAGGVAYAATILASAICERRDVTTTRTEFVLPAELDPVVQEGKSITELDAERAGADR